MSKFLSNFSPDRRITGSRCRPGAASPIHYRPDKNRAAPERNGPVVCLYGAGYGARTRGIQLGKLTLYKLS